MQTPESEFLLQLLYESRIVLSHRGIGPESSVRKTLIDFELWYRQHLAAPPPPLDVAAAEWSATLLYNALLALTDRSRGEGQLQEMLSRPCPVGTSATVVYSVDLTLRFLPDVARLSHAAAEDDPLNGHLESIGADWPLSSVGMEGAAIPHDHSVITEIILRDACLRMLYVDRIIERCDDTRLQNSDVRAAVRAAVSNCGPLTGKLAKAFDAEPVADLGVSLIDVPRINNLE